jgi:Cu+-exporting ATPase
MSVSKTTELSVDGMTCNNCARTVTEAIQGTSGVHSATVSLANKTATVRWNNLEAINVPAVLSAVAQSGYKAAELDADAIAGGGLKTSKWQWNLIFAIAATVLLMIGEWGLGLMEQSWFQWLGFVLAGAVLIFAGASFYRGAWNQLKVGSSNMDTLVALGSTTAFGYSTWALWFHGGGHLYFMEAAAIISLISFGHWIEARVSDRASGTLRSLLNLAPPVARRLRNPETKKADQDGGLINLRALSFSQATQSAPAIEEDVPVAELAIGDRIILRPGDRIPVDGSVIEGDASVDESMLTGEAIPVDKKTASEVFAGTLNLNGQLVLRVTATGESTALAHIISAVQRAQTSRAQIQRLGDRITSYFVPVIVVVALVAGLAWGLAPQSALRAHEFLAPFLWHVHLPAGEAAGFIIAAGVLIIACPCAMGLATPAAIMASANAAAQRGILIRDGIALEKAGQITAVIFDKTGTLTVGRPEIVASKEIGDRSADSKILAASMARNSTHPISQAIAKLSAKRVGFAKWNEIRGSGIEALISESGIARLGSLTWLSQNGVDLSSGEKFISEWSSQGATLIGLVLESNLIGLFALQDQLKTNAAKVIVELQAQKLKTFMVTGDGRLTALSMARQVGIAQEEVFAEIRPEEKADLVKKMQARGERVAFVGDGINDAPALSQADLGIAVSRASDVAREAADIILLKSEIEAVPECLALARATLRTIKQNLFWAFFYNAVGVPLAALGFVSPVICALAMGVSDLIVIGNALRLLRRGRSGFRQ